MKMKKQVLIAGWAILIALTISTLLTAQTVKDKTQTTSSVIQPGKFIDENKNGICDNYEARPANRRGIGYGFGRGSQWLDENKNGICDYFESAVLKDRGPRFVDDNNDGVCDNFPGRRGRAWRGGWNSRFNGSVQNLVLPQNNGTDKK